MSELAPSPGSSSIAPPPADPPVQGAVEVDAVVDDTSNENATASLADSASAPAEKAQAKKAKPKRKSTAPAAQSRNDDTASQAGEDGAEASSTGARAGESTGEMATMGSNVELLQQLPGVAGEGAGPALLPASIKKPVRTQAKRSAPKKNTEGHLLLQYTNSFVPGSVNIKNPAGDFAQRESNVDVIRQVSQARARLEKETAEAEKAAAAAVEGAEPAPVVNPLRNIIIIHPGSRELRINRASEYYPIKVPNCIARPSNATNWGTDAPVPGSRVKRLAQRAEEERSSKRRRKENGEAQANGDGDVEMNGNGHVGPGVEEEELGEDWQNPVDTSIFALREYLKEHLRLRRLSTNFDEVRRIRAANSRVKPEIIPEHSDRAKVEYIELDGKAWFVGKQALLVPPTAGFSVRYPILNRQLNTRDWSSSQLLMDDIGLIILEALRTEMNISPKDLRNFSVVLIVPDHGDRFYIQEMTSLLMDTMGFKEIAIHQVHFRIEKTLSESYTSIFSAGISTSCVVDVGATRTSITCVDEGMVVQDSRVVLNYGGNDVTTALCHLLERAAFPYKELDLARPQDWILMDDLKAKICTLEEHLVANTAWECIVPRHSEPTMKFAFRTFDENILAPLTWFDTGMIDFEEKNGAGSFRIRGKTSGVIDTLQSTYGETTAAMQACTRHLWVPKKRAVADVTIDQGVAEGIKAEGETGQAKAALLADADDLAAQFGDPGPAATADRTYSELLAPRIVEIPSTEPPTAAPSATGTPVPEIAAESVNATPNLDVGENGVSAVVPTVPQPAVLGVDYEMPFGFNVFKQSSQSALDGAIAASISLAGTENKIKAAAGNILLIGGASRLKGLAGILQDRLPHLIRTSTGINLDHVSIVPPPRGIDPDVVSWKGASVMCNLESLSDMWMRRDEWEAMGPRALKDRCAFL